MISHYNRLSCVYYNYDSVCHSGSVEGRGLKVSKERGVAKTTRQGKKMKVISTKVISIKD